MLLFLHLHLDVLKLHSYIFASCFSRIQKMFLVLLGLLLKLIWDLFPEELKLVQILFLFSLIGFYFNKRDRTQLFIKIQQQFMIIINRYGRFIRVII
ncbi:unnamed protein product [Paramecium sonneborni]|uniref:Uncharacterized protein n=1 Tax=Paramecium sonneborni TaxID=65129 RepID=A0A8S1QB57_9CILI|nr:unnamed protein product [Paramecium sonneborni]